MCYNKAFFILLSFIVKKLGDFGSAFVFFTHRARTSHGPKEKGNITQKLKDIVHLTELMWIFHGMYDSYVVERIVWKSRDLTPLTHSHGVMDIQYIKGLTSELLKWCW